MRSLDDRCTFCATPLNAGEFEQGRAMRMQGNPYCQSCLESVSMFCCKCEMPLRDIDFETGRAVTLIGRRYCETCLVAVVEQKRRKKRGLLEKLSTKILSPKGDTKKRDPIEARPPEPMPAKAAAEPPPFRETDTVPLVLPPPEAEAPKEAPKATAKRPSESKTSYPLTPVEADPRRMYYRYLPPPEVELILRPPGLAGLFGGNRVKLWMDVSEGGCRAIIEGHFKHDDYLHFKIVHRTLKESFDVVSMVRHAKESKKFPGCMIVGFKFVNPSPFLQTFINSLLKGHPSVDISQRRTRQRQGQAAAAAGGK